MPTATSKHHHGRQYDIVVFGATGYTGVFTAEQVAATLPTDVNWAIAGRSQEKLQKIATDLKAKYPDRRQPAIEVCNLNDQDLTTLVKRTFVLLATVGPYSHYGEYAFKACAQNGTHYLDVTGELAWTSIMIKKYEDTAKATGAIMIPQIGFESAPADLITFALAKAVREELNAPTRDVRLSVDMTNPFPSGGTWLSVFAMLDLFSLKLMAELSKPFALSPVPQPSPPKDQVSLLTRLTGLRNFPLIGLVTTSLMGGANKPIVERTWGLQQTESALRDYSYGPNFSYNEYNRAHGRLFGFAVHLVINVGLPLLTVLWPLRSLLRLLIPYKSGEGPSRETSARQKTTFRAIARPDMPPGSCDKMAFAKADFNGSMYHMTGICIARGAQTILEEYDSLQLKGGVYTPASLGQGFIDRVGEDGFEIKTKIVKS
ncbi:hypothetical protein MCOR27_000951 [Pyricularia oryzae]|uniref:Saccharopine dehydrogenase NADP binding domain-containing protein n=2 Tax=Pyricularia TaxID=48558 RepID=A0ABQ8N564_PYRGI|nr:hypothetical protein MCOR01_008022 [Pyricularia oryzae]KAI6291458.1 hypothetical protein MCOR33_010606 [Pyricularia grisea]KAH9433307.1 hypothetical protein MCOR02_005361 [Pyricularia oryzae]KAI6252938.1 hypothetical protein MCOR19_010470 [Pyricularia oryzae]KAI6284047.1 hypothetical protein MCOR26_002175 [Pyricularia oryzae]